MEMEELESYVPPLSEGEVESDDEDGDVSEDSEDEGGESDTGQVADDKDPVDADAPPPAAGSRSSRKACPRDDMAERLKVAMEQYRQDMFVSIRQCARHHRVSRTTLTRLLSDPEAEYYGKGKTSHVFSKEEETALARHITERMHQGCGLDIMQVRTLMTLDD